MSIGPNSVQCDRCGFWVHLEVSAFEANPPKLGWRCPVCNIVNAPWVNRCPCSVVAMDAVVAAASTTTGPLRITLPPDESAPTGD